jgi:hypothetical protein
MSQRSMILALKEASRKIRVIFASRGRGFLIDRPEEEPPDPTAKPKKRRSPKLASVTTLMMEDYFAEELLKTIEEVFTIIEHIEPDGP